MTITSSQPIISILELHSLLTKGFPSYTFSQPPRVDLGVLTTNAAFARAKTHSQSPQHAAAEIIQEISNFLIEYDLTNQFELRLAGPYVNFFVTDYYNSSYLSKAHFGEQIPQLLTTELTCILEFLQLNAAKQAHVGHIRTGNIGESLRRILMLKHKSVIIDRHLGDWGVQFGLVVWGIKNSNQHSLTKVDFANEDKNQIIQDLEKLYVEVNALTQELPEVRKQAQEICYNLEQTFSDNSEDIVLWEKIVTSSLMGLENVAQTLNLNQKGFWTEVNNKNRGTQQNWSNAVNDLLKDKRGIWELNQNRRQYHHDIDFGESFLFGYFYEEIGYWAECGVLTSEQEGDHIKYFIDLEEEKLGRVHLVSSDGYTTYMFRDVITRFVWAGLFGGDLALSCVDSRQSHSLKQAFAVIDRLLEAGVYDTRDFPLMSSAQTRTAVDKLKKTKPLHIANGYLLLTTGAMSSRKGNVFHFETLMDDLKSAVHASMQEKDYSTVSDAKVTTLAVAALKWADLNRDREQDVVFDVQAVTKFEGNTGVYQLYTYARLNNILRNAGFDYATAPLATPSLLDYDSNNPATSPTSVSPLNSDELTILHFTLQLPMILESITQTYKPHLLCNYVFELNSLINSWYAKHSVTNEPDPLRKQNLLQFTYLLKNHLQIALELLGIETLENM